MIDQLIPQEGGDQNLVEVCVSTSDPTVTVTANVSTAGLYRYTLILKIKLEFFYHFISDRKIGTQRPKVKKRKKITPPTADTQSSTCILSVKIQSA